jgi:hypothetical protein
MISTLSQVGLISDKTASTWGNLMKGMQSRDPKKAQQSFELLQKEIKNTSFNTKDLVDAILRLNFGTSKVSPQLRNMAKAAIDGELAQRRYAIAIENAKKRTAEAGIVIQNTGLKYKSLGSAMTATFSAMTSASMFMSSLSSLKNTITDTELSAWDRFS